MWKGDFLYKKNKIDCFKSRIWFFISVFDFRVSRIRFFYIKVMLHSLFFFSTAVKNGDKLNRKRKLWWLFLLCDVIYSFTKWHIHIDIGINGKIVLSSFYWYGNMTGNKLHSNQRRPPTVMQQIWRVILKRGHILWKVVWHP